MLHAAKGLVQTCGLKSAPGSAWAVTHGTSVGRFLPSTTPVGAPSKEGCLLGFCCCVQVSSIIPRGFHYTDWNETTGSMCCFLQATRNYRTTEYFSLILMFLPNVSCKNQDNSVLPLINSMKATIMSCPRLQKLNFLLSLIVCGN